MPTALDAFSPESPDCCWKCGRLGHHRQECIANVFQAQERSVRQLCKRMQKEFEISKKPIPFRRVAMLQNFPVTHFKAILVGRPIDKCSIVFTVNGVLFRLFG